MSAANDSVNVSRWLIEDTIKQKIESGVLEYRSLEIARAASVPLPLAFDHLMRLTRQKKLALIWQVRCVSCGKTVAVSSGEFPEACPRCGNLFSDAFPMFAAVPDYVAYVMAGRGA